MKIGFFGKLPSYGDFLQRNIAPKVIERLDNWLCHSIDASLRGLGDAWKDVYFNSPIWRFYIQGGALVDETITGLMMPSVDATGRCYPFVIVCQFEAQTNVFSLASKIERFHGDAEDIMIQLLDHQRPDLDAIAKQLQTNYEMLEGIDLPTIDCNENTFEPEIYRSFNQSPCSLSQINEAFLANYFKQQSVPISIWHSAQSAWIENQYRYYEGMPPVDVFEVLMRATRD